MSVASPANVDPGIPKEYSPFISSGEVALQGSRNYNSQGHWSSSVINSGKYLAFF